MKQTRHYSTSLTQILYLEVSHKSAVQGDLFQVDLSDSESEETGLEDGGEVGGSKSEDAMGRSRRAGDLNVNKKGTPLYSREDIREQYCINDKELQVLDKKGRKGILGCFSNNGQVITFSIFFHLNFENGRKNSKSNNQPL